MVKKSNYTNEEREKILNMLMAGYTANEIAISTGRSREAIKKEIQRTKKRLRENSLKDLKHIEKQAKIKSLDRKGALRALNHEVNSLIGTRALIEKNRTHYRYTKKGNLALKKKEYNYTNDMPKQADW
ncbi:hypothetical protein [Clostridium baratii]|uniref:hypothetical protein n=1 Tax=Clostridium baratii TaxID=1561 RepID=UPI0030CD771C